MGYLRKWVQDFIGEDEHHRGGVDRMFYTKLVKGMLKFHTLFESITFIS